MIQREKERERETYRYAAPLPIRCFQPANISGNDVTFLSFPAFFTNIGLDPLSFSSLFFYWRRLLISPSSRSFRAAIDTKGGTYIHTAPRNVRRRAAGGQTHRLRLTTRVGVVVVVIVVVSFVGCVGDLSTTIVPRGFRRQELTGAANTNKRHTDNTSNGSSTTSHYTLEKERKRGREKKRGIHLQESSDEAPGLVYR